MRIALTPLVAFAPSSLTDHAILWLYLVAFTTDYLDGWSARRLGIATPLLRMCDSTADTIFHLAVAVLILRRHPDELARNSIAIIAYLTTMLGWYLLDAIRWRRAAGFHAYSAKILAVALLVWILVLFGGWTTDHLLSFVLAWGIASNTEGIAISLILRRDRPRRLDDR